MRPQRIHHSNDDGDCDSNSANDADVDDDNDDGGKQQRKQMQQQHSSPATKTMGFAGKVMRGTALHNCQNHSTSRVGEKQRSMVSKEEEAKEARERGESLERLRLYIRLRLSVVSAVGE